MLDSLLIEVSNFTKVVFSRQRLSRLTFLKVFCLQTPLSDLKMIGVFTSKVKFHLTVI